MLEVVAGARIHISLADMGFASARAFGGVGFMIDQPRVRMKFQINDFPEWRGFDTLDESSLKECWRIRKQILEDTRTGVLVNLLEHPPQHLGFGSKTALTLSLITGLHTICGISLGRRNLQMASRRGGASGIGIHGFFEGGVLWDAGHGVRDVETLRPSSAVALSEIPPLMLRFEFPDHWRVGLCLPEGGPVHGAEEHIFFEREAPVDRIEVLRAMAALYHGVLPAFRLSDLRALRAALATLNVTGFKAREIAFRGDHVTSLLETLRDRGYAAGMSSMGPLVFVIFDARIKNNDEEIRVICVDSGAKWLGVARGLNEGARLTWNADP